MFGESKYIIDGTSSLRLSFCARTVSAFVLYVVVLQILQSLRSPKNKNRLLITLVVVIKLQIMDKLR